MLLRNLPLSHPKPDGNRWVDVLMGCTQKSIPPLVEYKVDDGPHGYITTGLLGASGVPEGKDRTSQKAYLDNYINLWYRLVMTTCVSSGRCPSVSFEHVIHDVSPRLQ